MEPAMQPFSKSDPERTKSLPTGVEPNPKTRSKSPGLRRASPGGDGGGTTTTTTTTNSSTTTVAAKNRLLKNRVFELENRLRETEEELEYYIDFYKQTKKATASDRGYGTSGSRSRGQRSGSARDAAHKKVAAEGEEANDPLNAAGAEDGENASEATTSDSDLDDGAPAAPGNENYTGEFSFCLFFRGLLCRLRCLSLENIVYMLGSTSGR